jgi:uncharacterized membrane protein
MKKRVIVFIAILIVLLGISNVRAEANFILSTEQTSQETCPTVFTVYQFTVTNNGNEVDTYTVSKSGSAANWVIVSPPGFVLEPGSSESLYVYVTPSKSARSGDYILDISVTGDKAGSKTSSVNLKVGECHAVLVNQIDSFQEICTGESTSYTFAVQNTGQWTENVRLSLAGSAAQWSSLSEEFLRLEPEESKSVTLFADPVANEVGDFDITVTVRSLESNALTSEEFDLKINGCYGVELSADENFASFCENSEVTVPLVIKNPGTASNSYNLEISGADWISLEQTQVTLDAGQQRTIDAVLFPGFNVQGKFPITITADTQFGDKSDDIILTANVMKCHDISVSVSEEDDIICPRTSKIYSADIMNTGTKTERFSLSLSAPTWVKLSEESVVLDASETATIDIIAEPEATVPPGRYGVTLESNSLEPSAVKDKDSMFIEIATKDSCFGVRTTAEKEFIKVAYGEGTLVPIVIENLGSETEVFELDVSGSGAAFTQLNPSSITITGNSAETIYLYVAVPEKTEKETYSVTVAARDESGVVSSSSNVFITVTDEAEVIPIPELEDDVSGPFDGIIASLSGLSDRITGLFAADLPDESIDEPDTTEPSSAEPEGTPEQPEEETPEESEAEEPAESTEPEVSEEDTETEVELTTMDFDQLKSKINEYRYRVGAIILIIILIGAYLILGKPAKGAKNQRFSEPKGKKKKKGIVQRFSDWLDEDVEEIEIIDEPKKAETKKESVSIFGKFKGWLEEDDIEKMIEEESKPSKKAIPAKKSEKSIFQRFSAWLEEDEAPTTKQSLAEPKGAKNEPKKVLISKSVSKPKETPKSAKTGGFWDKFVAWLEEDEEEIAERNAKEKKKIEKKTKKEIKKPKKGKTKKQNPKEKPKKKEGSGWNKFKSWLEEE